MDAEERITQLEARLAAAEQRIAELEGRTVGQIRFGPAPGDKKSPPATPSGACICGQPYWSIIPPNCPVHGNRTWPTVTSTSAEPA